MADPVLTVDDLHVVFHTDDGVVKAVDGVSYELQKGETLAVLGESGSGKTVHARAVLRILDSPPAEITGGRALLGDVNLFDLDEADMREVRGARIAMLFQDPHTALGTPSTRSATNLSSSCGCAKGSPRTRHGTRRWRCSNASGSLRPKAG